MPAWSAMRHKTKRKWIGSNDIDHIRRQMRLVAVERAEALRMRIFLDRAKTRTAGPLIEI